MSRENLRSDLMSENKFDRKKALESLIKQLNSTDLNEDMCQQLFNNYQVHILKCFRDDSEKCRELSIELMDLLIRKLSFNDYYLTYIFPVIVERIGSPEKVEESEELRLKMVELLKSILTLYSKRRELSPFIGDIIDIINHSMLDKYGEVKKGCCESVILAAEALPVQFSEKCEKLLKSILTAFTHQHMRVRIAAIEAVGAIVLNGSGTAFETASVPFAERLFDPIPQVRRTIITLTHKLLTEYKHRYSYFHKLLPLILTGLCDEVPDTRILARTHWIQAGEQYAKENEKELKDEADYLEPFSVKSESRVLDETPCLGCRALVQSQCSKILIALCNELRTSWHEDVLVRCGQLLEQLAIHAQKNMTMNLGDIIPCLYTSCRNDNRASEVVAGATETLGAVVPYDSWMKILKESLESFANFNVGHAKVILSLVTGLYGRKKEEVCEIREELACFITQFCRTTPNASTHLISLSFILAEGPRNVCIDTNLTIICLTSIALCKDNLQESSIEKATKVINICWLENPPLSKDICERILDTLSSDPAAWTAQTSDRRILNTLLAFSTDLSVIKSDILLQKLYPCLLEAVDTAGKLSTFVSLAGAIEKWNDNNTCKDDDLYKELIKDIVAPSLIWKAGRGHEAIRAVASRCLCGLLQGYSSYNDSELISSLVTLLEDGSRHTRRFSCNCLGLLAPLNDTEILIRVYQPLLDRLDDECEGVREATVESIMRIFNRFPGDLNPADFRPHLEHIVDTILVHLDDEDSKLKQGLAGNYIYKTKG